MIETRTFRLAAGVDAAAFLEADKRFQTEFIPNHDGFVRRTTARAGDGEWIIVTLWGSQEEADASAALEASDPIASGFAALIDPPSLVTKRFTELEG